MITLDQLLAQCETSRLMGPGAPLSAAISKGRGRVIVVAGANASGKSVFVQILAARARSAEALPISISIRERTGAGQDGMAGFKKTMMFGDEAEQSTGATSVAVATKGFSNLAVHAQDKPTLLILDEPEMGLSEDYSGAMGAYIARQAAALGHDNAMGVVVVTHSRALVSSLLIELRSHNQEPHFVCMGAHFTLAQWLAETPSKSVAELLALPGKGNQTRSEISKLLR